MLARLLTTRIAIIVAAGEGERGGAADRRRRPGRGSRLHPPEGVAVVRVVAAVLAGRSEAGVRAGRDLGVEVAGRGLAAARAGRGVAVEVAAREVAGGPAGRD